MANWVSAGCGVIANELAQAMEKRGQKLYGVVNRTQEKAVAFAEKYGVQNVFTSFEEVCADSAVDIEALEEYYRAEQEFVKALYTLAEAVLKRKECTVIYDFLSESGTLTNNRISMLAFLAAIEKTRIW